MHCSGEPRLLNSTRYHIMPTLNSRFTVCGVITGNGKAERSLHAEEYTTALIVEAKSGIFQPNLESMAKLPDTIKGVRTTTRQDSLARQELN